MKTLALPLLAPLFASLVLAEPTDNTQAVLDGFKDILLNNIIAADAETVAMKGKWMTEGKQFIEENGLLYELFSHQSPSFAEYRLRTVEPELCDPTVKQYSGYLDVAEDKHLFFWFFESRHSPEDAPLILWLNGGPGMSSCFGLLFELGPCLIADEGKNVTHNPYSWNTHANIIFLDQPVNVGFSYSNDQTVNNTLDAGKDMYAFLQLFLVRFPKYADAPFHVAGESYGGMYGPRIASIIHKANKDIAFAPGSGLKHISLASVVLGNGWTDPLIQMASLPDYTCEGPYHVYDDPNGVECTTLRSKVPTCQRLIQSCYRTGSSSDCAPAQQYCEAELVDPVFLLGLNVHDVRRKCEQAGKCYPEVGWIDTWMNNPLTKAALGVGSSRKYQAQNPEVHRAFTLVGDEMHNGAVLLPELLADGIRLLVYAGNADMMCNFIGNERWVEALPSKFQSEFTAASPSPWATSNSGVTAGLVRSAGGGGRTAGNLTFVTVYEAGHIVPHDQPEAALDLITSWIMNVPL